MRERASKAARSLAGQLLVAHPALKDPNFRRTVVLMTTHNPEGAMGMVLNRPMHKKLAELGGDFALGVLSGVPLFQGGPVEGTQLILAAWRIQDQGFQLHLGIDPEKAVPWVEARSGLKLAESQRDAIRLALKSKALVITGGPGGVPGGPPPDRPDRPFIPPIRTSISTRSGLNWGMSFSPSSPLAAVVNSISGESKIR